MSFLRSPYGNRTAVKQRILGLSACFAKRVQTDHTENSYKMYMCAHVEKRLGNSVSRSWHRYVHAFVFNDLRFSRPLFGQEEGNAGWL